MLLISMFQMGMVAMSPIVASITTAFPGTAQTTAQLAMTFLCLVIVLTALCSGIIARVIGRRLMCTIGMVACAAFGLLFSRVLRVVKGATPAAAFLMVLVSYLIICLFDGVVPLLIAGFVGGGSLSLIFPYYLVTIADRVDPSVSVISSSLILSVDPNLGSFVSPIVLTGLSDVIFGTVVGRFRIAAVCCAVMAIVMLCRSLKLSRNGKKQ